MPAKPGERGKTVVRAITNGIAVKRRAFFAPWHCLEMAFVGHDSRTEKSAIEFNQ